MFCSTVVCNGVVSSGVGGTTVDAELMGGVIDETKNDTILGVGLSPNLCIL